MLSSELLQSYCTVNSEIKNCEDQLLLSISTYFRDHCEFFIYFLNVQVCQYSRSRLSMV